MRAIRCRLPGFAGTLHGFSPSPHPYGQELSVAGIAAFPKKAEPKKVLMALHMFHGARDLSTAVVLRVREAQPSLKMTELQHCGNLASNSGWNPVYISVLENFGLERL